MRSKITVLLMSLLLLAGCNTVANPMNWFGDDAPDQDVLEPIENDNPLIPERTGIFERSPEENIYLGTPIDRVSELTVERVPGGIVIRAVGISEKQGVHNARLSSSNEDGLPEDGVLIFSLDAETTEVIGGPEATRRVVVGRQLTDQEAGGARTIRVTSRTNTLERRR